GYAKQYSAREARPAFRLHEALGELRCDLPDLRLPRVLGVDRVRHVIVSEPAPGRRLTELDAHEAPAALALVGKAVARWHGVDAPPAGPPFPRGTAASVRRAAATIGRAHPALDRRLAWLADRLERSRPAAATVLLHGDLHLKNAFLDGDAAWLIDL